MKGALEVMREITPVPFVDADDVGPDSEEPDVLPSPVAPRGNISMLSD